MLSASGTGCSCSYEEAGMEKGWTGDTKVRGKEVGEERDGSQPFLVRPQWWLFSCPSPHSHVALELLLLFQHCITAAPSSLRKT